MVGNKAQILNLQGGVELHEKILKDLGLEVNKIKLPGDIDFDACITIFPGGESTVISKLIQKFDLFEPLQKLIKSDKWIFGTCAGAILLASDLTTNPQKIQQFKAVDVTVERNSYGSQVFSKESELVFLKDQSMKAAYIRAPKFLDIGSEVEVLAVEKNSKEAAVLKQENVIISNCNPELEGNTTINEYMINDN